MNAFVDALAGEHRAFAAELETLLRLAGECRDLPPVALLDRTEQALAFLTGDLLPHASAEERALYPAVAEIIGRSDAMATMARDHDEIRRLIEQLHRHCRELGSGVLPAARRELERILYSLHAVISLHLAKEDELYLPLLGAQLDARNSAALLATMRQAVTADGLAADGG